MSGWSRMQLGDGLMAWAPQREIETSFQAAFDGAGCPQEMALFIGQHSEGRLHCEVTLYFSPAAMELAAALGAEPCQMPSPSGLDLLVGHEAAWQRLFPQLGRERIP
jgi:hypothetical protein